MFMMFRVILAVLLTGFVLHRGFYTRTVRHSADSVLEQPESGTISGVATILAMPALLSTLIYIIYPAWMAWATLAFPIWLRWLGVGVALGGFVLLQWAQQTQIGRAHV